MFCPECRSELPDDAKYCIRCSYDFSRIKTPARQKDEDGLDALGDTDLREEVAPTTFAAGSLFAKRYEILAEGKKGGMGAVYKCRDKKLDKIKALKVIHPRLSRSQTAIERFRQEVSISQELQHKNIVRVYDLDEYEGTEFFTMEWVEGVTLREIIIKRKEQKQSFTLEEANNIISQLAEALHYAHSYTIHRDVKPENILVTGCEMSDSGCVINEHVQIKLTDFGIAKMLTPSQFMSTSMQMGTPYYMAPEQKVDAADVDKRADIYAAGVVLFELLTLDNTIGLKLPSKINKSLPGKVDEVLEKALEPKAEDRYPDIEEFAAELRGIVKTTGKGKEAEERERQEQERKKREAEEVEKKRIEEERRGAEETERKRQEEDRKRREAEEQARRKIEEERQRLDVEKLQMEEDKKKTEELKRHAEEERKQLEEERRRQQELAQRQVGPVKKGQPFNIKVIGIAAVILIAVIWFATNRGQQKIQEPMTAIDDEFNEQSLGDAFGITYAPALDGRGAVFSREKDSRIRYPQLPREGTLEWWVRIDSGYYYDNFRLVSDDKCAQLFTTDVHGGDVTWPGSTWFTVCDNGDLTLDMAVAKHNDAPHQVLKVTGSQFHFTEWHAIGISYGSQGQEIVLDGNVVGSDRAFRQEIGAGGNQRAAVDVPTIGQSVSSFWKYHQYEGGFNGVVRRFRSSTKQKDWLLAKALPHVVSSSKEERKMPEVAAIPNQVHENINKYISDADVKDFIYRWCVLLSNDNLNLSNDCLNDLVHSYADESGNVPDALSLRGKARLQDRKCRIEIGYGLKVCCLTNWWDHILS